MIYGDNMPKRKDYDTPAGKKLMKLKKLATAIEMVKGPKMNIDDHDYRWATDKIEYMEQAGRQLTKDDMERANELWRIYG